MTTTELNPVPVTETATAPLDVPIQSSTAAPAPTGPPSTLLTLGPIHPNTTDLGLFITDLGGSTSFRGARIDLATGDVQPLPNTSNSFSEIGLTGGGATAQLVSPGELGGQIASPCGDGTWWVADQDERGHLSMLRLIRPHPGAEPDIVQTVAVTPTLRGMGLSSNTTADNLPVLYGPDGRLYVLDPAAGTVRRLADGPIVELRRGFFAESVCDDAIHCTLQLHGSDGTVVTIPQSPSQFVSFSPDGRHALIMRTAANFTNSFSDEDPPPALVDLRLVDMSTGEIATLTGVESAATRVSLQGFGTGSWCQWTPDGLTAMYLDGKQLTRIDVPTHSASTFTLPAALVSNSIIAVGIA